MAATIGARAWHTGAPNLLSQNILFVEERLLRKLYFFQLPALLLCLWESGTALVRVKTIENHLDLPLKTRKAIESRMQAPASFGCVRACGGA